MMNKVDRLKGRTIPEIARIMYGEKGAMAALARGLGISPGYLNNLATRARPMTTALSIKFVLLCREETAAFRKRADEIEALGNELGDIKLGEE